MKRWRILYSFQDVQDICNAFEATHYYKEDSILKDYVYPLIEAIDEADFFGYEDSGFFLAVLV